MSFVDVRALCDLLLQLLIYQVAWLAHALTTVRSIGVRTLSNFLIQDKILVVA